MATWPVWEAKSQVYYWKSTIISTSFSFKSCEDLVNHVNVEGDFSRIKSTYEKL